MRNPISQHDWLRKPLAALVPVVENGLLSSIDYHYALLSCRSLATYMLFFGVYHEGSALLEASLRAHLAGSPVRYEEHERRMLETIWTLKPEMRFSNGLWVPLSSDELENFRLQKRQDLCSGSVTLTPLSGDLDPHAWLQSSRPLEVQMCARLLSRPIDDQWPSSELDKEALRAIKKLRSLSKAADIAKAVESLELDIALRVGVDEAKKCLEGFIDRTKADGNMHHGSSWMTDCLCSEIGIKASSSFGTDRRTISNEVAVAASARLITAIHLRESGGIQKPLPLIGWKELLRRLANALFTSQQEVFEDLGIGSPEDMLRPAASQSDIDKAKQILGELPDDLVEMVKEHNGHGSWDHLAGGFGGLSDTYLDDTEDVEPWLFPDLPPDRSGVDAEGRTWHVREFGRGPKTKGSTIALYGTQDCDYIRQFIVPYTTWKAYGDTNAKVGEYRYVHSTDSPEEWVSFRHYVAEQVIQFEADVKTMEELGRPKRVLPLSVIFGTALSPDLRPPYAPSLEAPVPSYSEEDCDHDGLIFSATSDIPDTIGGSNETLQQVTQMSTSTVDEEDLEGTEESTSYGTSALPVRLDRTRQGKYLAALHARPGPPSTIPGAFQAPLRFHRDTKARPQNCQSWLQSAKRQMVTRQRHSIIIDTGPRPPDPMRPDMNWWGSRTPALPGLPYPHPRDISDYLAAFFLGLRIDAATLRWSFAPWTDDDFEETEEDEAIVSIGILAGPPGPFRVRVRRNPDMNSRVTHQLNVHDLLAAAAVQVPAYAYAVVIYSEYDLYEAGKSAPCTGLVDSEKRVIIVNSVSYHPSLDIEHGVSRIHSWPASHCTSYLRAQDASLNDSALVADTNDGVESPIRAAVAAQRQRPLPPSPGSPYASKEHGQEWLIRILDKACWGLCSCLGIESCGYYACIMQNSTSHIGETGRPPYVCPVDLVKLHHALKPALHVDFPAMPLVEKARQVSDDAANYARVRYMALLEFCESREGHGHTDAHAAWLRGVVGLEEDWSGNLPMTATIAPTTGRPTSVPEPSSYISQILNRLQQSRE